MATYKIFEELDIWQRSRSLANEIYSISSQGRFGKDFVLQNQMRKASISVMSNIAEGFERKGTKEFVQFLAIAKGSLGEIRSQLYIALDQHYIEKEIFNTLNQTIADIGRRIGGFINYLQRSRIKGLKYKIQDYPK
jgi:four helix bundle protein